jgi:hypothetical protein
VCGPRRDLGAWLPVSDGNSTVRLAHSLSRPEAGWAVGFHAAQAKYIHMSPRMHELAQVERPHGVFRRIAGPALFVVALWVVVILAGVAVFEVLT